MFLNAFKYHRNYIFNNRIIANTETFSRTSPTKHATILFNSAHQLTFVSSFSHRNKSNNPENLATESEICFWHEKVFSFQSQSQIRAKKEIVANFHQLWKAFEILRSQPSADYSMESPKCKFDFVILTIKYALWIFAQQLMSLLK